MSALFELLLDFLEPVLEYVLPSLWSRMKKKYPNYDNSYIKKLLTNILAIVIIVIVIAIILLGVLFVVECFNPRLFDLYTLLI